MKQTCELNLERPDGGSLQVSVESIEAKNAQGPTVRSALIDISERKRVERERDELGQRIREAAEELRQSYDKLKEEIEGRERAEAQVRQAQKMEALGVMSGGIAHDFNNMLAAIIGFSELLTAHAVKGSKDEHYLARIMEAGIRGRELVRQMLTFSSKTEQEKRPLRLSGIVKETLKLIREIVPSTIAIRVETLSESGPILADPIQIQQVLINLCTNAAQAMREQGGTLDVELSDFSVPPSVRGCPTDGAGPLHEAYCPRHGRRHGRPTSWIRYSIPSSPPRNREREPALGLSVVHGIVKHSGGYITVESDAG